MRLVDILGGTMRWHFIHPAYAQQLADGGRSLLELMMGGEAESSHAAKPSVHVWQASLRTLNEESIPVFCKVYAYPQPTWRFFGRWSKARRERRSAEAFRTIGLNTADVIACCEVRNAIGCLSRAGIITRAIPDSKMLHEFVDECCGNLRDREHRLLRAALIRRLARMVADAHRESFFHNDLHWRNVLVTWHPPDEPKVWWIDCPRGRFHRWSIMKGHFRIKDLATLDKTACQRCTLRERVRFARTYVQSVGSTQSLRSLLERVHRYRTRRWRNRDNAVISAPSALPNDNPSRRC